ELRRNVAAGLVRLRIVVGLHGELVAALERVAHLTEPFVPGPAPLAGPLAVLLILRELSDGIVEREAARRAERIVRRRENAPARRHLQLQGCDGALVAPGGIGHLALH